MSLETNKILEHTTGKPGKKQRLSEIWKLKFQIFPEFFESRKIIVKNNEKHNFGITLKILELL